MEHITLPSTILFQETDHKNIGKVVITPCHQGYGTTLGNSLRRVLLSSLPGAAAESVKIKGVQHEFSAIEGVAEDVIEIILNLKKLAVRSFSEDPVILTLSKKTKGPVTAGDFDKNSDVEIMNPDLVIATITDSTKEFEMEVTVGQGSGYVPVTSKDTKELDLGRIAIDSLYTPIVDVGYKVDTTRVGDVTDYEELTITIETNGTITAKEAILQATKILMDHFTLILEASDKEMSSKEELIEKSEDEVIEPEEKDESKEDTSADEIESEEVDEDEEESKTKGSKKEKKKKS